MSQAAPPPLPQPQSQRSYASSGYQYQPSNGLGLAGFIVSLVGLVITGGLLCPLGILMSGIAMIKPPRGFAIAGLVIGVLGTGMGVLLVVMMWSLFNTVGGSWQTAQTSGTAMMAEFEIDLHYTEHNQLPDDATGTQLIAHHIDPWGNPLAYRKVSATDYELISQGPDGQANTPDDIVTSHFALSHSAGHGLHSTPQSDSNAVFEQAEAAIQSHFSGEVPPTEAQAMPVLSGFRDQYGKSLRYKVTFDDRYLIISAGADGEFDTIDDDSYVGSMATE